MKKIAIAALLATMTMANAAHADVVPCEDMLVTVRAALKTAKLNEADTAKVTDLEAKGVERCNADDDKRADGFFADALKLMGK